MMEPTKVQAVCPRCQSRENIDVLESVHEQPDVRRLFCRQCEHTFDANLKVAEVLARFPGEYRLNLGCGRFPVAGWINIDSADLPEVDLVVDLEAGVLPFETDSIAEIAASHLLEHIRNSLGLMQELHRVAKPGATAIFRVPYGSSDDADADPTHVRRYFWGSWGYFSQPYYWRADYGYRGDWEVEDILLFVNDEYRDKPWEEVYRAVQERRNVVTEMVATLRAIKPARPPLRALQKMPPVRFSTQS